MDSNGFPGYLIKVLTLDNPWLAGAPLAPWYARYLPPRFIPRTCRLTADHRVCLVVGPRQTGKSTLIWKTIADTERPVLYLNCEEPAIRAWLVSPAAFLADIQILVHGETPLFFDEIQHLEEAGLFLKGLADRKTGRLIYATGSSSFDLQAKTRESLTGRAMRHLLLPFSLEETRHGLNIPPALEPNRLPALVHRMVVYGGYPSVYTSEAPLSELTGLVEAFLIRDASDRLRIKHVAAFRKLLELIATQIGNLCNYSEWATVCGISAGTVREYVSILEDSHVARLIRPFVGGKRAEVTSTPKAYFVDNGLRNQVFGGFIAYDQRADRGSLLENFLFSELYKAINPILDTIRFWRSKSGAEVDFVLEQHGLLSAWEAKAGLSRPKVSRSSRSFIEAYRPRAFFVVSENRFPSLRIGETPVHFISYYRIGREIACLSGWDRTNKQVTVSDRRHSVDR